MEMPIERKEPFFSIIVPIYNAMPYLQQCAKSLLQQTFTAIEIIFVNDGSTDESLFVCREYEKQDDRVVVWTQNNLGRVAARKAGVRLAKGQYISFVDADDWLEEDMYEQIYNQILKSGRSADIVAFGLVEEYGSRQIVKKEPTNVGFYEKTSLVMLKKHVLYKGYFFEFGMLPHLCDKIFRKDNLLTAGFMEMDDRIVYGEDAAATFRLCLHSRTLQVLDITPYHYRQNNYINGFQTLQVDRKNFCRLYREIYERQITYYFWFVLLLRQFESFQSKDNLFPYNQNFFGKRVILYGAGGFGIEVYKYIDKTSCCKIVSWVDREYAEMDKRRLPLDSPQKVYVESYDYILITILNEHVAKSIKDALEEGGIAQEKILYIEGKHLKGEKLPKWLTEYGEKN